MHYIPKTQYYEPVKFHNNQTRLLPSISEEIKLPGAL